MRILWLKTELLHPVDKGGRIRTYQMLKALIEDPERLTRMGEASRKLARGDAAAATVDLIEKLLAISR